MDDMIQTWNNHLIRPQRNQRAPSGRPCVMYNLPSLFQTQDYLCPVSDNEVTACAEECLFRESIPCEHDMYELCTITARELGLHHPLHTGEALDTYVQLRGILYTHIDAE